MKSIAHPSLHLWLNLSVNIGPAISVSSDTDGLRSLYPITGGVVQGPDDIHGTVLPGGFDNYAQGSDGVGIMDARYAIRLDDGTVMVIHNRGYLLLSPEGAALESSGMWPVPAHLYHCRCQPEIQTGPGPHAWVNQQVFVGTVHYPAADQVDIAIYRMD